VIQAWDFRPGANFVLEMQRAATEANRTIAVLSQKYLESTFTASEWAAALAQDPQGRKQKLIPIRIAPCELTGILAPIIYLDLVGLPEKDASAALLGAFSARNKPFSAPGFPGATTPHAPSGTQSPPQYPAISQATSPPLAESLASLVENSDQNRRAFQLSALQHLEFMRHLNALLPQHFNMLVVALDPEPGLIPDMLAPQADRATALVKWAKRPGGCGLSVIQELLKTFEDPK
jgi:TIR domain